MFLNCIGNFNLNFLENHKNFGIYVFRSQKIKCLNIYGIFHPKRTTYIILQKLLLETFLFFHNGFCSYLYAKLDSSLIIKRINGVWTNHIIGPCNKAINSTTRNGSKVYTLWNLKKLKNCIFCRCMMNLMQ